MRKLTPKEAVARVFPSHDLAMADRVIAWLDHCGYEIVEKHEASVLPPEPTDDEREPAPSAH
ncbi:hypothetical protein [Bradyrhizobium sp. RT3a]|uniref:hypothetical protein n=1 Tax=unclassified Bradyrhizobium TaxID=2631580 RepID=UPI003397C20F